MSTDFDVGDTGQTRPLISVITACLNGERHIGQTIASVAQQRNITCEHIVVDGGSTDGTLAILATNLSANGRWISERDSGIADAMNKGIAMSRGEWLLFLQSDDYLAENSVLASAATRFAPETDICGFPVMYGSEDSLMHVRPRGAGFWLNFKTGFNHQGTFIRRTLFNRLGGYDTSFKIAMDYEFFLRARRSQGRFRCFSDPVVAVMRSTGISSQRDWPSLQRRFAEERLVHEKHQTPAMGAMYAAYWAMYPAYRRALSILKASL
jgi:glycosyltransferase involved in cell wall biosynthesis